MCSGSEAGAYLRLIDFVYHSTREEEAGGAPERDGYKLKGLKDFFQQPEALDF